jgi:hypothetical protein
MITIILVPVKFPDADYFDYYYIPSSIPLIAHNLALKSVFSSYHNTKLTKTARSHPFTLAK